MRALLALFLSLASVAACPLCALKPSDPPALYRVSGGVEITEAVALDAATQDAIFAAFTALNDRVGAAATASWIEAKMIAGKVQIIVHTKALQGAIVP